MGERRAPLPGPPPLPGLFPPAGPGRAPATASPRLVDEALGANYEVTGITVIGAAPDTDPEVVAGRATIIRVAGPDVDGVAVRIRTGDEGATVLATSDGKAWLQTSDGSLQSISTLPVPLADGDRLRIGPRVFVFHSGQYREA